MKPEKKLNQFDAWWVVSFLIRNSFTCRVDFCLAVYPATVPVLDSMAVSGREGSNNENSGNF